jgi:hypothetical protein
MPLDLLDRLIMDLCAATETLIGLDDFDLAAWEPFPKKDSSSKGSTESGQRHLGTQSMNSGIHKTVC